MIRKNFSGEEISKHAKTVGRINLDLITDRCACEEARDFSEDYAAVKVLGKWGYINLAGHFEIMPVFDDAGQFKDDLAPVKYGEKWGYIDKKANVLIDFDFDQAGNFYEGLAGVYIALNDKDTCGAYIDREGLEKIVINGHQENRTNIRGNVNSLEKFSEGIAAVELDNRWGFVDKRGAFYRRS